jgi:hypothetical protein
MRKEKTGERDKVASHSLFSASNQSAKRLLRERERKRAQYTFKFFQLHFLSRPITESRMASTTSFFFLPPNMIRPTTMSTPLKAKRQCRTSFFITDILGNRSRSPSSGSGHHNNNNNKNRLISTIVKDGESGGDDDDDTMLHDSDDNGKKKDLLKLLSHEFIDLSTHDILQYIKR